MKPINLDNLLQKAQTLCQSRGVRLTSQRLSVLRLIAEQPGAISAYDLLDLLREVEPQAKPPTVYRGLEFLLEQGFIHKIESTNSFVMCTHFERPSHISALFICDRCNSVMEKDAKDVSLEVNALAAEAHFYIRHSVIEAHGLCEPCHEIESCKQKECCGHDHSHDIAHKKGK